MKIVLFHKESKEYIYPLSREEVFIKVNCPLLGVSSIELLYWKRFKQTEMKSQRMSSFLEKGLNKYYFTSVKSSSVLHYFLYVFKVFSSNGQIFYFSSEGLSTSFPHKPFEYVGALPDDAFITPASFKGDVGYHIFVDRFNRDTAKEGAINWDSKPTRDNVFGGTLKGITLKVPYLKDLGVKTLFLTPIFEAKSNHKYDTGDYFKIDPSFGNLTDFQELVSTLHQNGLKLVLDGVFNHIGYYSKQFQDVIKNGKNSPFYKWFFIKGEQVDTNLVNYECVGDYKWMPKLNTSNPETQDYLVSVALYWLYQGADGWRLDVGDELADSFRKKLRYEIKASYPNAFLLAETWRNGEDLLRGDEVDSIMNYCLRDIIIGYLVKKSLNKEAFIERLMDLYFTYQKASHHVLYNLLDSHDTERFLSLCEGNRRLMKLAIVYQFLLPGMPVIYYGDEVGMEGANDPLCRAGMKWEHIDKDFLAFYKKMTHYKNFHSSFKDGDLRFIPLSGESIAFLRSNKEETMLVGINPSLEKETINISQENCQELRSQAIQLFDIEPQGFIVEDLSNKVKPLLG